MLFGNFLNGFLKMLNRYFFVKDKIIGYPFPDSSFLICFSWANFSAHSSSVRFAGSKWR